MTNHSVAREVVTFFTLPPGEYIVMPQTNVRIVVVCGRVILWCNFALVNLCPCALHLSQLNCNLQWFTRYQIVMASSYFEFWPTSKVTFGEWKEQTLMKLYNQKMQEDILEMSLLKMIGFIVMLCFDVLRGVVLENLSIKKMLQGSERGQCSCS